MPRSALDAPVASETRAASPAHDVAACLAAARRGRPHERAGGTAALAAGGPYDPETANMLLVAQGVTLAALSRDESRGGHYRTDFPERDTSRDGRHTMLWPALPATGGEGARGRLIQCLSARGFRPDLRSRSWRGARWPKMSGGAM